MSDKMREEFEDWFSRTYPLTNRESTQSEILCKMIAEQAWVASREDQVIDFSPCNVQHSSYNNVDCYAISDVAVILGRHGLKVKP